MKDTLQKFMIDNAPVRGEFIELTDSWQQVLARRTYPIAVQTILGEMMSAAALLTANLKFNGTIIMQIHGDGPVRLLVVECDDQLRLRATAKIAEGIAVTDNATLTELVNAGGTGRFAITLDPNNKLPGQQAYQGIVPLDGDDVATVIENYMLRSEQLDTKLWLASSETVSRGLLLQKLPTEGGVQTPDVDTEAWERLSMLGNTLRTEELLTTDIDTLMHRLFWEETVRIFEPQHPAFFCSCSREKVGSMLKMLGAEEVEAALAAEGTLDVHCDFCSQHYQFDPVDCAQLFLGDVTIDTPPSDKPH